MFFAHLYLFNSNSFISIVKIIVCIGITKSSPLVSPRVCWQKESGKIYSVIQAVHCNDDSDDNVVTVVLTMVISTFKHIFLYVCCHLPWLTLNYGITKYFTRKYDIGTECVLSVFWFFLWLAMMIYQWHQIIRTKVKLRFDLLYDATFT